MIEQILSYPAVTQAIKDCPGTEVRLSMMCCNNCGIVEHPKVSYSISINGIVLYASNQTEVNPLAPGGCWAKIAIQVSKDIYAVYEKKGAPETWNDPGSQENTE